MPIITPELVGEKDKDFLLDMLWVGGHNPQQLIPQSLCHFRVIFNGLHNIGDMIDMRALRDQLFQVRSAILDKMQHCIPHFILDKYQPTYRELLAVQKLLAFELKIMSLKVVHPVRQNARKHIVVDAPISKHNNRFSH